MDTEYIFSPIGVVHSCFTEKFGIPRQPGLATAARGTLEILPPYDQDEAFNGLTAFSHLWLIFVFHGIPKGKWQPTVRPPRLGGNRRIGIFTTRTGFRPNPIGMSAVVLEDICRQKGRLLLEVSGIDLLDQTPVLDIKPYLPYADIITEANGGFASQRPTASVPVAFTPQAEKKCEPLEKKHPGFRLLLEQVLATDPRPAYADRQNTKREFGLRLYGVNVRWTFQQGSIIVHTIDAQPWE